MQFTSLGFGGAPLGNLYQAISHEQAIQTVEQAYQLGLRYFDTAPLYGHGLSERRMGLALDNKPRNEWIISSKVGRLLTPAKPGQAIDSGIYQNPPPFHAHYDYSYDGAWRSVEHSLQRLACGYLDIAFIHDIDTWTHGKQQAEVYQQALKGAAKALAEMREQGLIKAFGLGVNEWQVCEKFLLDTDANCFLLAGRYSLLEQEALRSFLPLCQQRQASVVIGGPYNTGILATGAIKGAFYNYQEANESVLSKVRKIESVCMEFDIPLASAALNFPLAHPAVKSVIPGAKSADEVESNHQLLQHDIPEEFWQQLKLKNLLPEHAPTPTPNDRPSSASDTPELTL